MRQQGIKISKKKKKKVLKGPESVIKTESENKGQSNKLSSHLLLILRSCKLFE
jgi:hypothetical protein